MVTRQQILENQKQCKEIRKRYSYTLNDNKFDFSSVEDMRAYYKSEPFEEFDKRFRSGN